MQFQEALAKYFRVNGHVARGQVDKPRNRGRWGLAYMTADMGFRSGVEIGTLHGDSAEMWCTVNPQLHLTCIDPYGDYRRRHTKSQQDAAFAATSKRLASFNVTMLREMSFAVAGQFQDESLDFLHIDGNHTFDGCAQDLICWVPKVRVGGLIVVHDYFSPNWPGVTQSVDAYVNAHGIYPWYVTPDVSLSVFWQQGAERPVRTI
jgi:hypothetical protein